ncbi:hypothetical protein K470DRAFT_256288 [Piedraia hortae CBS 480.64]|uniref:F-box domain-containing protein n=1 Tax=Piedraia hortae CBS 480.64 TaxID=1314780 RepID=A0A6A7C464_9PEZI|nr:hypothetical protein K470DRAFT_256288 [Piedraia hortae CBS 480.64]
MELVLDIVGNLHPENDRNTLAKCSRVNKKWADVASEVLWSHPQYTAFARLSPARKKYYAPLVKPLDVEEDLPRHLYVATSRLQFPKLRTITFTLKLRQNGTLIPFKQFFKPTLEVIRFNGLMELGKILHTIPVKCPDLKELHLSRLSAHWRAHMIRDLVAKLPQLEAFSINGMPGGNLLVAPIIAAIADNHKIHTLSLKKNLTETGADQLVAQALARTTSFLGLKNLNINLEGPVVARVPHFAQHVRSLTLHIHYPDYKVFDAAEAMPKLQSLAIVHGRHPGPISRMDLRKLHNLKSLRYLGLRAANSVSLRPQDLTALFYSLQQLKEFHWLVPTPNAPSADIFIELGRHSQSLRALRTNQPFDLLSLYRSAPAPYFPQLEKMHLARELVSPDAFDA